MMKNYGEEESKPFFLIEPVEFIYCTAVLAWPEYIFKF